MVVTNQLQNQNERLMSEKERNGAFKVTELV